MKHSYVTAALTGFVLGMLALALVMLATSCAGKKPIAMRFSGVTCSKPYTDRDGNERRDCQCQNGKQIGIDARRRAAIIRCE